jgi:23S rRNA pseudouridine1911/1915/1917 synthase
MSAEQPDIDGDVEEVEAEAEPTTELEHRTIHVPEGLAGERVDSALARLLGLSRTRASELVAAGHVQLDGQAPAKSDRVLPGTLLEVSIPAPRRATVVPAEVEGMRIVFQDDDIVVVDKPVGVAAHPSVGWSGPTVLDHLAGIGVRISTSGAPERRGIVHRLDVGTSGLMAVAKSEHAYTVLKQAFRDRTVDKTYHALVQGHPDPHTGTIDAPIARHPKHDFKFTVKEGGRDSITHYDTLEAHRFASLLTIKLETGRTHQIRVHMSALHHPCVGDLMYGADPTLAKRVGLDRQWLHAHKLGFVHPRTGEYVEFESEYPADLVHALDVVRASD